MANAIIRVATPKTKLTPLGLPFHQKDQLVAHAYHHLRPGRLLDCSTPDRTFGYKRKRSSARVFNERGLHSIQFTREAAIEKQELGKLLAIIFAATEIPQALLSNEWIQTHDIEVQMVKPDAHFEKWETVTLANLSEFMTAEAPKKVAKEPTAAPKQEKAALTTTKYKFNKAQKRSLKWFVGSIILVAADLLAAWVTPIPYLVAWGIGAIGCIINAFSIEKFIRSSIFNYLNYKGKGILEINEKAFNDPIALKQGILDLGLGRGIDIKWWPTGFGNYGWQLDDNKRWEELTALLVKHAKIELNPHNIYEDITEKGKERQVIVLCSGATLASSSQGKLITLKGLGWKI